MLMKYIFIHEARCHIELLFIHQKLFPDDDYKIVGDIGIADGNGTSLRRSIRHGELYWERRC